MVILWLLGGLAILIAVVCVPPLHLRSEVYGVYTSEETPLDWDEIVLSAHMSGLWGGLRANMERRHRQVRGELQLFGITKGLHQKPAARDEAKSARRKSKRRSRSKKASRRTQKRSLSLGEIRKLLPETGWLLREARRLLGLRVEGNVVYGLSDPFETALTHALIVNLPLPAKLELTPDYKEQKLGGHVALSVRVYPFTVICFVVRSSLRPGVRSVWWPRLRSVIWRTPKKIKEAESA